MMQASAGITMTPVASMLISQPQPLPLHYHNSIPHWKQPSQSRPMHTPCRLLSRIWQHQRLCIPNPWQGVGITELTD